MSKGQVWVRWILFFPLAIFAYALVYPVMIFIQYITNTFMFVPIPMIFVQIVAIGASAAAFVFVGAKVAPKAHFTVSIVLFSLHFLKTLLVLVSTIALGEDASVSLTEALISLIVGNGFAAGACHFFYMENQTKLAIGGTGSSDNG